MRHRLAVICLILAVGIGFLVEEHRSASELQDTMRASCARTNAGLRAPLYGFMGSAARARTASAREAASPAEAYTDRAAAHEYRRVQAVMRQAVADVAQRPGSPLVDCEVAFPEPAWP